MTFTALSGRSRELLVTFFRLSSVGLVAVTLSTALSQTDATKGHRKYQTLTNAQVTEMLDTIETDIRDHYYDPHLKGLDVASMFARQRQKIANAPSQNEALLDVAAAVASLNDSHTRFLPPQAPYGVEYGWVTQAVGDSACYVTQVRPGSDAAAKGLRPGDQVLSVNEVALTRQNLNSVEFGYRVFPQAGLHLVVRATDGTQQTLVPMAKIFPGQAYVRHSDVMTWLREHAHDFPKDRSRYHQEGDVLFWKLPDFFVQPADLDGPLDRTRKFATVVLDLRSNPGGSEFALTRLIGGFFDHDVRIGQRAGRKGSELVVAKTRGRKAFEGRLIVLVDSSSTSAAEIFARVVQIQKRGVVLGDRTGGAVMEANVVPHAIAVSPTTIATYGVEISEAALTMADGGNLENVGVNPDQRITPTPGDIAASRDPVLARAAELSGLKATSEDAGKIFPFEWPAEKMPQID